MTVKDITEIKKAALQGRSLALQWFWDHIHGSDISSAQVDAPDTALIRASPPIKLDGHIFGGNPIRPIPKNPKNLNPNPNDPS